MPPQQIPPHYSADGRWWWTGVAWVPTPQPQYVKIAQPSFSEQAAKAILVVVLGGMVLMIVLVLLATFTTP